MTIDEAEIERLQREKREAIIFLHKLADCLSGWSVNRPRPTTTLLSNAACDCAEMVQKLRGEK
jgi:hypothetical protein